MSKLTLSKELLSTKYINKQMVEESFASILSVIEREKKKLEISFDSHFPEPHDVPVNTTTQQKNLFECVKCKLFWPDSNYYTFMGRRRTSCKDCLKKIELDRYYKKKNNVNSNNNNE